MSPTPTYPTDSITHDLIRALVNFITADLTDPTYKDQLLESYLSELPRERASFESGVVVKYGQHIKDYWVDGALQWRIGDKYCAVCLPCDAVLQLGELPVSTRIDTPARIKYKHVGNVVNDFLHSSDFKEFTIQHYDLFATTRRLFSPGTNGSIYQHL
jgi:hypothetical protein